MMMTVSLQQTCARLMSELGLQGHIENCTSGTQGRTDEEGLRSINRAFVGYTDRGRVRAVFVDRSPGGAFECLFCSVCETNVVKMKVSRRCSQTVEVQTRPAGASQGVHVRHVEEDGRGGAGGVGGHRRTLKVEKVDAGEENCCSLRCTWPGFLNISVASVLYVFPNVIRFPHRRHACPLSAEADTKGPPGEAMLWPAMPYRRRCRRAGHRSGEDSLGPFEVPGVEGFDLRPVWCASGAESEPGFGGFALDGRPGSRRLSPPGTASRFRAGFAALLISHVDEASSLVVSRWKLTDKRQGLWIHWRKNGPLPGTPP